MVVAIQQYVDKALDVLKRFGQAPVEKEQSPLEVLLQSVVQVDQPKVVAIAQTLRYMSAYNKMVRANVADVKFSDRYNDITSKFDSIIGDANMLKTQLADGKIDWKERTRNFWMRLARGSTHKRFEDIRKLFLAVSADSEKNVAKEDSILNGYTDFRMALKQVEGLAYEVTRTQEGRVRQSAEVYQRAQATVDAFKGDDNVERAKLQLARDEAKRTYDNEDRNYQLVKDVAEFLAQGYVVGEALMSKLKQKRDAQDALYRRGVTFFNTNEHIFTAMDALFAAELATQESAQTLEAMKGVADKGMKYIQTAGAETDKRATEAAYGRMYDTATVKGLLDSVVEYYAWQKQRVGELREQNTKDTVEMNRAYEETQGRLREIVTKFQPGQKTEAVALAPSA